MDSGAATSTVPGSARAAPAIRRDDSTANRRELRMRRILLRSPAGRGDAAATGMLTAADGWGKLRRMTRSLRWPLLFVLSFAALPARAQFGDPLKVTLKITPVANGV